MTNRSIVVIVDASAEDFPHLEHCLSDWECVNAALNSQGTALASVPVAASLFIVYAQKEEKQTLAICEIIRNLEGNAVIPILLVIGRYDIPQGAAVRRMGHATFIIRPFDEKELRIKIEGLIENPKD